jgi:peptidoglycan hydrolase-like amidase
VLRVKSWDRKPSWDKSGTMNDNIFRGKIEIRNENGNIVLINELPLEDYLKGLGEVSNGDNAEKVKTILVAARSYAYFYLQKENRKFPGKPYDASDDPNVFQKYLGYGLELRSLDVAKLVDATNGEMITHSGVVVKPWYFNESDGKTLSYVEYCRLRIDSGSLPKNTECKEIPYLKGAVDPGGVGHTRKGHGVGISGIGATYFATNLEWKYPQIIGYYLDGTEVRKIY